MAEVGALQATGRYLWSRDFNKRAAKASAAMKRGP
jgi:hypothetical protein